MHMQFNPTSKLAFGLQDNQVITDNKIASGKLELRNEIWRN